MSKIKNWTKNQYRLGWIGDKVGMPEITIDNYQRAYKAYRVEVEMKKPWSVNFRDVGSNHIHRTVSFTTREQAIHYAVNYMKNNTWDTKARKSHWAVLHNRLRVALVNTENEAFMRLQQLQPNSADFAMRYEGWKIEKVK